MGMSDYERGKSGMGPNTSSGFNNEFQQGQSDRLQQQHELRKKSFEYVPTPSMTSGSTYQPGAYGSSYGSTTGGTSVEQDALVTWYLSHVPLNIFMSLAKYMEETKGSTRLFFAFVGALAVLAVANAEAGDPLVPEVANVLNALSPEHWWIIGMVAGGCAGAALPSVAGYGLELVIRLSAGILALGTYVLVIGAVVGALALVVAALR